MTLSEVELASPEWLWLYPTLLVVAYIWNKTSSAEPVTGGIEADAANSHVFHPYSAEIGSYTKTGSVYYTWRTISLWLVLALLTLALAQPERVGKRLPDPLPQRDIVFIVDTSVSMTLRDYIVDGQRVSRMAVVKGVLDEFVRKLKGSHLSVIVFGEYAYSYVPLTNDHDFVRKMLARMQTTMAGRFNAIGDGVALAVKAAKTNRHTVLVLLTDADRETGEITPANAAVLAKQAGLPLYTIAIGAATLAAEEQRTSGLIYQPVNLELLDKMASTTGAKNYRAGATLALKEAIADIEKREQRKVEQAPLFQREALYMWLLYPGLLLTALLPLIKIVSRCRQ